MFDRWFFPLSPSPPLGHHPEGKKFTQAAIRRGLSVGHVISLWFYYLKTTRRLGWEFSKVFEAATGPIYIVPEFSSQSP